MTPLATHLVLTKESALLKDIKVLKELCETISNLSQGRYYSLLSVLAMFGLGKLLQGIAAVAPFLLWH